MLMEGLHTCLSMKLYLCHRLEYTDPKEMRDKKEQNKKEEVSATCTWPT